MLNIISNVSETRRLFIKMFYSILCQFLCLILSLMRKKFNLNYSFFERRILFDSGKLSACFQF